MVVIWILIALMMGYAVGVTHEAQRTYNYLTNRLREDNDNRLLSDCITGLVLEDHKTGLTGPVQM